MCMNIAPKVRYKSIYEIDFARYFEAGYRYILFDIDNTLVPHDAPADEASCRLIRELSDIGFKMCIVSNNNERRAGSFAGKVGCDYVWHAEKPSRQGYEVALALIEGSKEESLAIGDQLFTDIWGANRAGIFSILTDRITRDIKPTIKLKRIAEFIVKPFCMIKTRALKNPKYIK